MDGDMNENVMFIGIILTFIIGIINVVVTIRSNNKSAFITTVTNARKEYIQLLRDLVAEFAYSAATYDYYRCKKLVYQLKLMMNPASSIGGEWDNKAVNLIEEIVNGKNEKVDEFVMLMQSWLALEWDGITNESKRGILLRENKNKLRKRYWKEYKKYLAYKSK